MRVKSMPCVLQEDDVASKKDCYASTESFIVCFAFSLSFETEYAVLAVGRQIDFIFRLDVVQSPYCKPSRRYSNHLL